MTADYWAMTDADLAAHWRQVDADNLADIAGPHSDDSLLERLNMIEDAILQRIGAPDHASGDDPAWQDRIRTFGQTPKEGS